MLYNIPSGFIKKKKTQICFSVITVVADCCILPWVPIIYHRYTRAARCLQGVYRLFECIVFTTMFLNFIFYLCDIFSGSEKDQRELIILFTYRKSHPIADGTLQKKERIWFLEAVNTFPSSRTDWRGGVMAKLRKCIRNKS